MEYTQSILKFIIQHFCKPCDRTDVKRRQCILVGSIIMLSLLILTLVIYNAILGAIWKGIPALISLAVLLCLGFHCWYTKRASLARLLYSILIYGNVHSLVLHDGFARMPHLAMVGLLAPILSMFVGSGALESVTLEKKYTRRVAMISRKDIKSIESTD